MTAPDGMIKIPLNEESSKGAGQIEEFLMQFNGEGIQHVAFLTDDLLKTWDHLKSIPGMRFMTAPPRKPTTKCSKAVCRTTANRLINCKRAGFCWTVSSESGDKPCLLLQIFSETPDGAGVLRIHPA